MASAPRAARTRFLPIVAGVLVMMALACGVPIWQKAQRRRLDRALIAAVRRLDAHAVADLLSKGADPNARDTPDPHQTVWQMLRSLARPSHKAPETGDPALMLAIRPTGAEGDLIDAPDLPPGVPDSSAVVEALLRAHANPNQQDVRGYTALMWALRLQRQRLVEDLMASGANPGKAGREGLTPLMVAVYMDDVDEANLLLLHGADVNACDISNGQTALILATTLDLPGCVQTLLRFHGRVDLRDRHGKTALDYARSASDTAIVHLLTTAR